MKRLVTFTKQYGPLFGSVVQHLFPSKNGREGKVAVLTLEDLPQSCKDPRLKIKSIGRVEINDLPDRLNEHCKENVKRERERQAQDPDKVICALVFSSEEEFLLLPFIFNGEQDVYNGKTDEASKTAINLYCDMEAERIVGTINSLAQGERKDLKSATKRPSGSA